MLTEGSTQRATIRLSLIPRDIEGSFGLWGYHQLRPEPCSSTSPSMERCMM